jgi:hypothetical protein
MVQRKATMLRITTHDDAQAFTFQVEGRLIGEWAKELERSWMRAAQLCGKKKRIVDLTGILFIDEEGKSVLEKICREGALFRTADPLNASIVSEIRANRQAQAGHLRKPVAGSAGSPQ